MVIEEDVATDEGVLIVCRGQVVSFSVRRHLMKFREQARLVGKILVSVSEAGAEPDEARLRSQQTARSRRAPSEPTLPPAS